MQYESNLAYDLSRFDVEEQEKHHARRKAEQEQPKQEIKMNTRSVSRSGSRVKVIALVGAVFIAFCAVNVQFTKADDWARKVTEQRAALTEAQDQNTLLVTRLESRVNTAYVEQYATETLGMAKVANSQIKYLSVNTESLIEVQQDGNGTIFEGINNWFGDLLEYIGL